MKRTTERADLAQKQVPEYISGCRQFEGEDLSKYSKTIFKSNLSILNNRLPIKSADQRLPPKRVDQGAKEGAPMGCRKLEVGGVRLCRPN